MRPATTHCTSSRTRFDRGEKWLEDGSGPMLPMHIVDVPIDAKIAQSNQPATLRVHTCASLKLLDDYIGKAENATYGFRFISICQRNSWSRLQITKQMLDKVLHHHDIELDFLEVLLCFFDRMNDEEQSFCVPWTLTEDASSIRMCYTFRYAEFKTSSSPSWVIRQAGVYQKFDTSTKQSVFVLVNAVPDSRAHNRVIDYLSTQLHELKRNPLCLHTVIHASYFMQWRMYLAEYERQLLPIVGTTMATFIDEPLRVTHDSLGLIRSLENRFLPMNAVLLAFEEVLCGLEDLIATLADHNHLDPSSQQQIVSRLRNWKRYSNSFARTALFLQQKSSTTATLIADTLEFRNQAVVQIQNGSMMLQTRLAVLITIITLVYAPWTLITGIFGMEFFLMDEDTHHLSVSPQIWQFFATGVATTIFTLLLYFLLAGFPRYKEQRKAAERSKTSHELKQPKRHFPDIESDPRKRFEA